MTRPPAPMALRTSLRRDDDEAIAVGRVEQRGCARLTRSRAAGVQEQDRLTDGHLQPPVSAWHQPSVDDREHIDEQPATDLRPGQRLHGPVEPGVEPGFLGLRTVADDRRTVPARASSQVRHGDRHPAPGGSPLLAGRWVSHLRPLACLMGCRPNHGNNEETGADPT